MLQNILYAIVSLFLGSTFSKILTRFLVYKKNLNLFSNAGGEVIFLSQNTALLKTFDVVQITSFALFSVLIFLLYILVKKFLKCNKNQETFIGVNLLIVSFLSYIFITFVGYSSVQSMIVLGVWFVFSVLISFKIPNNIPKWENGKIAFTNGIIVGFYLLLLSRHYFSSLTLPISLFIATPIYFYLFSEKNIFLKNPVFILFFISAFFSFNKIFLLLIAVLITVLLFLIKPSKKVLNFTSKLYPFILIFIFLYNPLFYFGNFDTVEEGFWASWLQRLISGQHIYSDFAAHHPPLLIWGLHYFSRVFGPSLYNMRLYFHILQIVGYVIFYILVDKIIDNKWIKLGTYLMILVFISTFLRNNIEIRLASSFLPMIFIYLFRKTNKNSYLFLSGIFSSISLLISTETGIASLLSTVLLILFSSSRKNIFREYFKYFLGVIAVLVITGIPLFLQESVNKLVEYISFYAGNFSSGYQNIALERPEISSILEWYKLKNFILSEGFKWEFSIFIIVGTLIVYLIKIFKKNIGNKDLLVLGTSILGIILSRSAMARSDFYHINYIWILSLILLGVFCEYIQKYSKSFPIYIFSFLLFFVGSGQNNFINSQIFKFQSYANLSGSYPKYETNRSNLTVNIDINTKDIDDLVKYIEDNVKEDESIFVFVQEAEIYFLTDRKNATSFDNPTVFFSIKYQDQMIDELTLNKPKIIVYDPEFSIAGISVKTLSKLDTFIKNNYKEVTTFGKNTILVPVSTE